MGARTVSRQIVDTIKGNIPTTPVEMPEDAKPWVMRLARLGYAAKGAVYALIGLLALQAASGTGSANVEREDALQAILIQPFGGILLALVVIGLIGYVVWRFVQAVVDPEHEGRDLKGLVQRIAYVVSAIGYAAMVLTAVQMMSGFHRLGSDDAPEDWTAAVLSYPLGQWLIGLVGLIICGVALAQFLKAYKADFEKRFRFGEMSTEGREWMKRLGRIGYFARGFLYLVIGAFLVQAAVQHDPVKAGGLGDAFQALAGQPYGPWLLGTIAIGLIAFGAYTVLLARYRRIYI